MPTILASITTPVGVVRLIGDVRLIDSVLYIERAHIGGLSANALGIVGH